MPCSGCMHWLRAAASLGRGCGAGRATCSSCVRVLLAELGGLPTKQAGHWVANACRHAHWHAATHTHAHTAHACARAGTQSTLGSPAHFCILRDHCRRRDEQRGLVRGVALPGGGRAAWGGRSVRVPAPLPSIVPAGGQPCMQPCLHTHHAPAPAAPGGLARPMSRAAAPGRDFNACYLLHSKHPQTRDRSYIG